MNASTQEFKVRVTPHRSLNSCKGVIRCWDLRDCSDEELLDEIKHEGVTHVKHIFTTKNGSKVPTNTFILTFSKPTAPKTIKASYLSIPVEPFIPNPLRCFNCQKFGHGRNTCNRKAVCAQCGDDAHGDDCHKQSCCTNCGGPHPAFSKECPEWITQRAITEIKVLKNVSFTEARQMFQSQQPTAKSTYASAVKSTKSISTQTDLTWPNGNVAPKSSETSPSVAVTQHTQTSTEDDSHLGAVGLSVSTKPANSSHGGSTPNIPHYVSSTPKQKIHVGNQKPGPVSSKQGLGKKPVKGNDPVSLYNRFGSLDSMDVELSPGKGPGGRKNR